MAARKTVTVVFCDIVDSTPLAERLDPEVHRRVMDRYYQALREPLERHGGTVEKFIGDAIMAVFGIPVAHDDDALRALRAASEMRVALAGLNEDLQEDYDVTIGIRTGVNTGEVVAGDHLEGSAFATGDTAGTAQRLESAARSGEILVGDGTYRLVSNAVLVEPVEALTLKGKAEPVDAWRLLGVVEGAEPFVRRLDTPMVGRDQELDALRKEFDQAVSERRLRLVTIVGPAGIGKSRLANELVRNVEDDASALVGRCLAYGEGITYWPLRGLVLSAVGDLKPERIEAAIEGADDAARIAGHIAGAVGSGPSPGGAEETFWAVRKLLEHLARERAARRRHRRAPVGRAGVPRPDRVPRGLEPRRADPPRLPGASGPAREAPVLAGDDLARPAVRGTRPSSSWSASSRRSSTPTSDTGSRLRPRATRCSWSSCSP